MGAYQVQAMIVGSETRYYVGNSDTFACISPLFRTVAEAHTWGQQHGKLPR